MARYMVTHHSTPQASQEEVIQAARQVVASLPPGTEWLSSWWVAESGKLICEWEAPDPGVIRASLEPAKAFFPIETIDEVQWIDPQWYR
ncbi:MAG: DUF4242 domain-containing protein [Anaerolineales bacterium]|nr:MAG: DUF4242 domain-containing protein [Anaerolineales bacterium]